LLTGAGYIGAALLRRLEARGLTDSGLVILENFYSTPRDALYAMLPDAAKLIDGDVAEASDVARAFDALGTDRDITVFLLAAQPSAAMAVREPYLTERSNLVGARVVLEAARARGARVVFGGSFRVYGDDLAGECANEQTPYGRVSDLSHLSKIYVEQLGRMLELRFASVRLGVTYGLSPIMKTTPVFMTVPNLFCQRAADGEVLNILEDRPMAFIHADDAAEALLLAADAVTHSAAHWQAYNAAPQVATIGHIARVVQGLMQARGGSVRIQGAATSEATFQVQSHLGLRPRHSLETSLGDVLDYFMARR